MYTLTVSRSFVAQHYLTVPDPGPEGSVHSHHFTVDATLEGPTLDEYGYLLDIDDFESGMEETTALFRDELLNELDAFAGENPSVEQLAQIFGNELLTRIETDNVTRCTIAVQEDDVATVSQSRTV